MEDGKLRFAHPSYGMAQFSHRQGNPVLFHSSLETHYNYVVLSVKTCELIREDTGDTLYGPMHGNIVEVAFSQSQFAELLTTMNIGAGVACTIQAREGKMVERPPQIASQTENMKAEFTDQAREFTKEILREADGIDELLKKPTLNRADRAKISSVLRSVSRELTDKMPFMVDMYQEATEKIKTDAKAEVEGFMVGAVRQAGLAALAAGKVDVSPPQLPPHGKSPDRM